MLKKLKFPIPSKEDLVDYIAGEEVLLEGYIYTARDRVHKMQASNKTWPFELLNNAIFYAAPTPKLEMFPFGSCGPTTAGRMDPYTSVLYDSGLAATIGKGPRSREVIESIKRNKAIYLVAYGGCGALYGTKIKEVNIVAFEEYGPQAIYKIRVEDFPVFVGVDINGKDIYKKEE